MNHDADDESTDDDDDDRTAKRPRREWSPGPQVPPAPPPTPATLIEARTPHGRIPVIPLIQNADALERDQLVNGELATPAPTKTVASKPKMDDFYHWVVGTRYDLIRMLGRGSYGQVAQAKDRWDNNKVVAIKRIANAFEQEIDAVRLYRETHILRQLRGHDCIIRLLNVIEPPSFEDFTDLYLVFDYVDTDLYKLIMSPQYLTTEHIQTFLYQIFAGLKFIHSSSVIHRDLKPANILLNEDCSLKICDFGLARIVETSSIDSSSSTCYQMDIAQHSPKRVVERSEPLFEKELLGSAPNRGLTRQLTRHVVTRWYRAPEIILVQPYTSAVDIWSVGCILAELLSMQEGNYQDRSPLFPGGSCFPLSGNKNNGGGGGDDDRLDQLNVILGVIGTPDEAELEGVGTKALEYIKALGPKLSKTFESMYPAADPNALDLLHKMLHFNPKHRVTATEALKHEFFKAVRRKEFELEGTSLAGPTFLDAPIVDLDTIRQQTYKEVLWYSKSNSDQLKKNSERVTEEN